VRVLADDLGPRASNTSTQQRAAQYIHNQLLALGYVAELQPYSFNQFKDNRVEMLQRQPDAVSFAAKAFSYSGSASVEGPMAGCGYGRPTDFPSAGLRGRIALIERGGGLAFQQKVSNAVARDAAGVVIFNDRTGDFWGALAQQAPIPVVSISQYDGKQLLDRLRSGSVVVSLKVNAATESYSGSNVVASSQRSAGMQKVVIGAHYDSVPVSPGANDNASGVGTLLALADALRGRKYSFEIEFVAFGDEEVGLIGSKKYVDALSPEERDRIVAMINIDMVGVGEQMEIGGETGLSSRALAIAQRGGYRVREMSARAGSSSDHASFIEAGIPAVFFYRADDPNYHTKLDTADRISADRLEATGDVVLQLLEKLGRRN